MLKAQQRLIDSTVNMTIGNHSVKHRGGDVSGFDAMNKAIDQTGYVYMSELDKLGTTVTSTETLKSFLLGMHLHTTL